MRRSVFLFAVLAIALAGIAHADTVYSTFPELRPGSTASGWYVWGDVVIAAPFVPNETVTLTDAVLALHWAVGTTPMNVYIESSVAGSPGLVLDTLTQVGGTAPAYFTPVDFTCSACSVLTAGTNYFLVARQSNSSSATDWDLSSSVSATLFSNQLGSPTGPWSTSLFSHEPAFAVNGTPVTAPAVPEPSTLSLLATGLFGTATVVRRRVLGS